jgi:hypothetical protein
MRRYFLGFLFSSLYPCVPDIHATPDFDDFTPIELQKIAQAIPTPAQKPTIILPTMAVKFDIVIKGDSIVYNCPVFTIDGMEVVCSVCGMPPYHIEVTDGKLKCLCSNHMAPKKPRVVWV